MKHHGIETPILFGGSMLHQTVAASIESGSVAQVVSGGFVHLRGNNTDRRDGNSVKAFCDRDAMGAGVKSRGREDEKIILREMHQPDE